MTLPKIGFQRTIKLDWLNIAASFTVSEPARLPELATIVQQDSGCSIGTARQTAAVLRGIWQKTNDVSPSLHELAASYYHESQTAAERSSLHFGLSLIAYPFFRDVVRVVGQTSRLSRSPFARERIYTEIVKVWAERGSVKTAVGHVLASLVEWGILSTARKRSTYVAHWSNLTIPAQIDLWLLACAIFGAEEQEVGYMDLLTRHELFPFRLNVNQADLDHSSLWVSFRQGRGTRYRLAPELERARTS